MGLKFLHISDIHFENFDGKKYKELDSVIQEEILHDLETLKTEYGKINGFLIGGDIAFSGKKEEYEKAHTWIEDVCKKTGCETMNVFTVPGNHDVDWEKHTLTLRTLHSLLKSYEGDRAKIDATIKEYLNSKEGTDMLHSPFENYAEFASRYGGVYEEGNILYWEYDFKLDDIILTIRGVNSAIVSNRDDHEQNSKLVLGTHQALMHRKTRNINLILCHHPFSWLADGQKTREQFASRARLQLFGHRHEFATEQTPEGCLIISAGAMQPERHLPGWDPRYNIIDLSIPSVLTAPTLRVKLYKRKWDSTTDTFIPDHPDGKLFEEYTLPLSEIEITGGYCGHSHPQIQNNVSPNEVSMQPVIDLNNPDPLRKLSYLFLSLPDHTRINIADDLQLLQDGDIELTDIQLAKELFKRAVNKNILYEFWEKVKEHSTEKLPNPFQK